MTINKITNTPILVNNYNGRGIITNKAQLNNCVRQADGTLWAMVSLRGGRVNVYKSTDNGFSWSAALEGIETGVNMREQAGFNADGPMNFLVIDEQYRNLDVYMGEYESVGGDGSVERRRYDLDDLDTAPSNTTVLSTLESPFQGAFHISHNHEQAFLAWTDPTEMYMTRCSPRTTSISSDLATGAGVDWINFMTSVTDNDGNVYIASLFIEAGTSHYVVAFIKYNSLTPSWGSPVEISDLGASSVPRDMRIVRDGYGTLCVFWYADGATDELQYSLSTDDGANWSSPTSLTRTSGHSVYNDAITSDQVARNTIIAGSRGGFILSYVEDNSVGTPRTYFRQLTTTDGSTYTLGSETEGLTQEVYADKAVCGANFFRPTDTKLLDISDPGQVRVAYQVGEGNSTTQSDTKPITIAQELLSASAYPSSLSSESGSHTLDTADSVSLRVLVDIHAGPNSLEDFYAAGLVGNFTERYMAAFDRIGTPVRMLRYDPKADNYLSDVSAYDAPVEYETKALFDPVTYSFPSPALNRDTTIERIEQDVRKMHLPPDFFLSREFLVNNGGYMKRTVWICEYYGNQYEISQVIPRFIDGEICFYECNAYVVGPSRDPFSRIILPSET